VHAARGHLRRVEVAQGEVELGIVEVGDRVVAETRMSMSGCSRWNASIRGSSQSEPNEAKVATLTRRPAARAADLLDAAVELGEPGLDRAQQRLPVGRDLHRARCRGRTGRAELVLEALDLPADRRLGEVQLVGGGAEAEQPGDRLEGPQVGQGEGRRECIFMLLSINRCAEVSLDFPCSRDDHTASSMQRWS
jgi:hypothetical protein